MGKFKFIALLGLLFAILSCRTMLPTNGGSRRPASKESIPTFQEIREILVLKNKEDRPPKTIAETLGKIRTRFPTLFDHYTLAYKSRSLQGPYEVDYLNPRAIVFDDTASLIFSFNGAPQDAGFASLEFMEFDEEHGYQFREVLFKQEPNADLRVDDSEIEYQDDRVAISKPNPQVCSTCHGQPLRPNWEPYAFWPGFFGGFDDDLFGWQGPRISSASREDLVKFVGKDLELDGYHEFLKHRAKADPDNRYQYLSSVPSVSPTDLQYDFAVAGYGDNYWKPKINTGLTDRFSDLMARAIIRDVKKTRNPARNLAILGYALCGGNLGALPAPFKWPEAVISATIKRFQDESDAVRRRDEGLIYDLYQGHLQPNHFLYGYERGQLPPREEFVYNVNFLLFNHIFDDALVSLILERMNLHLLDYATNFDESFNRLNAYENGVRDFLFLKKRIQRELSTQINFSGTSGCDAYKALF